MPTVPVTLPSSVDTTSEAYLKDTLEVSTFIKLGSVVRLSNNLNLPSLWSLNKPVCLSTPSSL